MRKFFAKRSKEEYLQTTVVIWMGALLSCLLWGSAVPIIKIGYESLSITVSQSSRQIVFAGYRFFLAGILTIILGSILHKKVLLPQISSLKSIGILSLFQTIGQYFFFYIGVAHTSGVKSSILVGMGVFAAILVSSLIFRQEKLSKNKIIGCIVGFVGVILINWSKDVGEGSFLWIGEGFIILADLAYAFSTSCFKVYSKRENPVTLSGYQFVVGGIVLTLVGIVMGGGDLKFSGQSLWILFYLALVSSLAYTIWGILMKYNPVSKVAVFGFMNPVFGVLLSALLLKERGQALGVKSLFALFFVSLGIYIVNRIPKDRRGNL